MEVLSYTQAAVHALPTNAFANIYKSFALRQVIPDLTLESHAWFNAEKCPNMPMQSSLCSYHGPVEIHQLIPPSAAHEKSAKNHAPTLSPVVMMISGSPAAGVPPVPAEGSPLLVPPESAVRGGVEFATSRDWMTSNADICWPTPLVPSHTASLVHLRPHVTPLVPPLHCWAAALAEAVSFTMVCP